MRPRLAYRHLGAITAALAFVVSCQIDNRALQVVGGDVPPDAHLDATTSPDDGAKPAPADATVEGGDGAPGPADGSVDAPGPGDGGGDAPGPGEGGAEASVPDGSPTNQADGMSCVAAGQCASSVCADGVCCHTVCAGSCSACNVANSVGTCTSVPAAQMPAAGHPACGPDPQSTCGRDGTCDGAGACRKWPAATVCASSTCDAAANTSVGASKCDGSGNCVAPASVTCAPYTCKSDNTACYSTCTAGGTECAAGKACNAGSCGPKVNGSTCGASGECASGTCADGVCCATSCTGQCQACNVSGHEGTCSPVPAGQPPATGRTTCGPDAASTCLRNGACDGAGACQNYGITAICAAPACNAAANASTAASKCDGNGNCVAPSSVSCAPYKCKTDNTACYASCTAGGAECSSGNVCNGSSCGLKVNGASCSANGECAGNLCVDGVCCASACTGQCQACDVSGSAGVCATVLSGAPHGSRAACSTDGSACGGACGGSATACTYPGSSLSCRSQTCASGVLTLQATCGGGGSCGAVTHQNCPAPTYGTATCLGDGKTCSFTCDNYHQVSGNSCVAKWTAEPIAGATSLFGIFGSSASDVYAVDHLHVYHSTGTGTWTTAFTVPASGAGSTMSFSSVWVDAYHPLNVLATGSSATILVSTDGGQSFNQVNDPNTSGGNYNVATGNGAGGSGSFLWAIGNDFAMSSGTWTAITQTTRYAQMFAAEVLNVPFYFLAGDASGWLYTSNSSGQLSQSYNTGWSGVWGMWGAPPGGAGHYAVGSGGGIVAASSCSSGGGPLSCNWGATPQTSGTTQVLLSVYGAQVGTSSSYVLFAVGAGGTILSSTGDGTWTPQTSNTTATLTGVWAASPTNVFASGYDGTVMHFMGP